MKAITILSGGIDSAVVAYYLKALNIQQEFVTFYYDQRNKKELRYAENLAIHLTSKYTQIDLCSLSRCLTGSTLTDDIPMPHGLPDSEIMKANVVPNRNAIFICAAWGIALARGADMIANGIHAGTENIYKDCRKEFITSLENTLKLGTDCNHNFELFTPFIRMTKTQIVSLGNELKVPFEKTWSCYEGGALHCGKCGACTGRKAAFKNLHIEDPTEYES